MARPQPARRRARGGGGGALDRAASALAGLLSAVNDPANRAAQLTTAEVLLAVEAVLCLLIIRRVPCAWGGQGGGRVRGAAGWLPALMLARPSPAAPAWLQIIRSTLNSMQIPKLTGWLTCRRWAAIWRWVRSALCDAPNPPQFSLALSEGAGPALRVCWPALGEGQRHACPHRPAHAGERGYTVAALCRLGTNGYETNACRCCRGSATMPSCVATRVL